jgi:A/G-specific adenine glycosylase
MHQTAKIITERGHWPKDVDSLKRLPGVGAYTAAAIASIAFEKPVAVVDGNVIRVLSRAFGAPVPYDRPEGMRWIQKMASDLLCNQRPGEYNQAMMDMGAVLCTPKKPKCTECFWSTRCVARTEGRIDQLPEKSRRTKVAEESLYYTVLICRGYVALFQRPNDGIWAGLYEFLRGETNNIMEADLYHTTDHTEEKKTLKHALSHRSLTIHLNVRWISQRLVHPLAVWVRLENLKDFPLPRPLELFAQELTLKYGRTQQGHAHRQPRQRSGG